MCIKHWCPGSSNNGRMTAEESGDLLMHPKGWSGQAVVQDMILGVDHFVSWFER